MSGCSSITVRTWSTNAPECRTVCGGTCTTWTPTSPFPPAAWTGTYGWTGSKTHLGAMELSVQVRIAIDEVRRIRDLTRQARALEREVTSVMQLVAPELLAVPGCGPLTAAKLVGEAGGVARFRSEAAFAMHCGVGPLEASSGERQRHRLNRSGNRQLNAALHRMAVTQLRMHGPAKTFLDRKRSEGQGKAEALRCLKRHLARLVYKTMLDIERRKAHWMTDPRRTAPVAA
jgi:transposase